MSEPRVLVVDDEAQQCAALERILRLEGFSVKSTTSGHEAVVMSEGEPFDVVISDLRMPDLTGMQLFEKLREVSPEITFIIMTAYGTVESAVAAIQSGVYDYVTKPIDADHLARVLRRAVEVVQLRRENVALREQVRAAREKTKLVGNSPQIREVTERIAMVADSDATVLIRGESGTGKELVTNMIHAMSSRAGGPLIKINCAAIPESLLEDELFGHEKGAFTGAETMRKGRFELAHRGTLFLDEIAEMSMHLQAKLLRVIQEQQFERIGGTETLSVDVRLLASTNRDLEELVRKGKFREDLYYRINVVPIVIPPLRERRADIILLANHFLHVFSQKNNRHYSGFAREAQEAMLAYSWPGNVRELENCVERAVVMSKGSEITEEDLALSDLFDGTRPRDVLERLFGTDLSLDELEKEIIQTALARTNWNQSQAAALLGLTRRTLQYRTEKYGIRRSSPEAKEAPQG